MSQGHTQPQARCRVIRVRARVRHCFRFLQLPDRGVYQDGSQGGHELSQLFEWLIT